MAAPCFHNLSTTDNQTSLSGAMPEDGYAVQLIKFLVVDITVPFVCCLGLVGNLLSLVVLATERLHRTLTKMEISAHIGLIALAVSDFLFCLLVLIVTQIAFKNYYEEDDSVIYFDLLANGLITIFIIASTWLIVVMAAERYIAVCHPLRARKVISLRRTRVVTLLVFLLCSLATVPIFLERTIEEIPCPDGRLFYQLRRRSEHSVIVRRILWAIFFDFIPCIALIYFNTCLIVQIRKAKRLREGMTQRQQIHTRHKSSAAAAAAPGGVSANTKKRHHDNHEVTLIGGEPVNNKCSQALLRPENGCGVVGGGTGVHRQSADTTTCMDTAYKIKQTKDNEDGCGGRHHHHHHHHWPNGHDAETARSSNSPRASWSCDRLMPSPRLSTRSADTHYSEVSKLNHASDRVVRRAVKTSTVKKRPSDSALNSVTATLVAVVILFLILVSPCEILKFSLSYTSTGEHKIVTFITNFMQVTNFSLNFLLYCAVNKSFRYTLKRLAFSCWYSMRDRC